MGLPLACLAHLEQEEALLSATLTAVRRMRAALLHGDLATLQQALEEQGHTARAAEEIREARNRLREQMAAALGRPAGDVTLQRLAAAVGGEIGRRLAECRGRLVKLTAEIDRINRGNAAMARHSADFFQELLAELTGGDPHDQRYGPGGRARAVNCEPLIEARG